MATWERGCNPQAIAHELAYREDTLRSGAWDAQVLSSPLIESGVAVNDRIARNQSWTT
jgi:hypothetical protein